MDEVLERPGDETQQAEVERVQDVLDLAEIEGRQSISISVPLSLR
jgi:hypothetical protein